MSENVIIALIGCIGAVLGALITGFATIIASKGSNGSVNLNSCAVVGLIASVGAVGGLILGAFFGVFLFKQTTIGTGPTILPTQVRSNQPTSQSQVNSNGDTPAISVKLPESLSCQHNASGYCGLEMTVTWSNIDPASGYYIYTIGHGVFYQPEIWWVAGNGFAVKTSSGEKVITDSAYGESGQDLGVFVCLTKTQYTVDVNGTEFNERPHCEVYSSEISFQPK